jgi:hypothetical protein
VHQMRDLLRRLQVRRRRQKVTTFTTEDTESTEFNRQKNQKDLLAVALPFFLKMGYFLCGLCVLCGEISGEKYNHGQHHH